MSRSDIPKKVFAAVLALLLIISLYVSIRSAISVTYCNKDKCPLRFDLLTCIATFGLMGSVSLGAASLAHIASKKMVKAVWPNTNL